MKLLALRRWSELDDAERRRILERSTAKIFERMNRIIAKIAAAENFSMIFDKSALVFAKPHLDLTNELIRRYNAGEGADGKVTAAAPAAPPKN